MLQAYTLSDLQRLGAQPVTAAPSPPPDQSYTLDELQKMGAAPHVAPTPPPVDPATAKIRQQQAKKYPTAAESGQPGISGQRKAVSKAEFESNLPESTFGSRALEFKDAVMEPLGHLWNFAKSGLTPQAVEAYREHLRNPQAPTPADLAPKPTISQVPFDIAKGLGSIASGAYHTAIDPVMEYHNAYATGDWDRATRAATHILTDTVPTVAGAAELAKAGGRQAVSMLPSTEQAGEFFQQFEPLIKDRPIDLTPVKPTVEAAYREAKLGAPTPPKPLRDFVKAQRPTDVPFSNVMTYEEGRRFASNAGKLSVRETQATNKVMQAKVGDFARAMDTANRDLAVKAGYGNLYDQAMREYRQASRLGDIQQIATKYLRRAALGAVFGTGAVAGADIYEQLKRLP